MMTNLTRREALTMLSAVAVSAAIGAAVPTNVSAANDFEEIARAWAGIGPLERKFFYDQLHAFDCGEPNIIDHTADYTFDEWAKDIRPWERDMIARAFQSPDIRTY